MATGRTRLQLDERRLSKLLDRFDALRVVVVGDVILDEYLWGHAERVSPEAPVPVVRISRESVDLGGAANVARNVVALGGRCALCGVTGDDGAAERIRERVAALGIDPQGLVVDPARPTTHKTRVVARTQQVIRYDREHDEPLGRPRQRALERVVVDALAGSSGAILADYGKGTLAPALVRRLIGRATADRIAVAVDPKHELAAYRGAALVKPNAREAARLSGLAARVQGDVARVVASLRRRLPGSELAITRGARGILVCDAAGESRAIATPPEEVFDVQGAGDTTIAALFMARLAGASLPEAAVIANAAAGVVVGKIGTASANRDELRARLAAAVEAARRGDASEGRGDGDGGSADDS